MKKINFFLSVAVTVLSLVLFSACGSAEGDSKPLPTMVPTNGANSAFVLPEATLVSIQNTKRGCEILMMTELGRQVFVLPYHYDISAYDGLKVSTTEGKKKIEPFDVFGKEREFFSDGEVKLYPDKAVAFEMPDGSAFVLIALDGVDLQKLQYLRFTMQKGEGKAHPPSPRQMVYCPSEWRYLEFFLASFLSSYVKYITPTIAIKDTNANITSAPISLFFSFLFVS